MLQRDALSSSATLLPEIVPSFLLISLVLLQLTFELLNRYS